MSGSDRLGLGTISLLIAEYTKLALFTKCFICASSFLLWHYTQKPLFLKISPDMDKYEMLKVVEMSAKSGASGIIATNTTIDYTLVENPK